MILQVPAANANIFLPLLQEMCVRENDRGDTLDADRLLSHIKDEQLYLMAVYGEDGHAMPLMLLIYSFSDGWLRNTSTVWINNIFVPSATRLRQGLTAGLRSELRQLFSQVDRVLFATDNPGVPKLVADLGFGTSKVQEVYRVDLGEADGRA